MNPIRKVMSLLVRVSPLQMLILIAAFAAVTTYFVGQEIDKRVASRPLPAAPVASQKTRVVFCTKNVTEGDILTYEALEVREVEEGRAPIDALGDPSDAIGRPAKYSLLAGAPLVAHDLAAAPGTLGFQAKLHPGERAVTLGVDANTGVAGFIKPDSRVDVMVQVGAGADTKTKPILSDVRVLAAGTTYQKLPGDEKAEPTSNVTLAVDPAEATKLINGMTAGRIYLTLRSDRDHTPLAVTDVNSLLRKPVALPPMAVASIPPLPPPIMPSNVGPETGHSMTVPPPPMPSMHEIEQWQGNKRDVASVHQE